jgi:hypothetical protein
LPSVGNRRIKRKSGLIKIIEIDLVLVFLFLQGCKFTLTLGKGCRLSETFSRLSHPLPSKTGFFGETFQGRDTDALGGFGGEALDNLLDNVRRRGKALLGSLIELLVSKAPGSQ